MATSWTFPLIEVAEEGDGCGAGGTGSGLGGTYPDPGATLAISAASVSVNIVDEVVGTVLYCHAANLFPSGVIIATRGYCEVIEYFLHHLLKY